MIRSMTAYGRSKISSPIGEMVVEISSLNRKHLDIKTHLPRDLLQYETLIRKQLEPNIKRGAVHVKVQVQWSQRPPHTFVANMALIDQLVELRQTIESKVGIQTDLSHTIDWVLKQEGVVSQVVDDSNNEEIAQFLSDGIDQALKPFVEMKEREGKALSQDMIKRLAIVGQWVNEIEALSNKYPIKVKERIQTVLQEYQLSDGDDRLLREVALIADRADIAEEMTRLYSHINQLETLISGEDHYIGKTVEFLLQEIFREVNTIGSKNQEVQISQRVVKIKSEIERVKEQVQNVE